MGACTFAPVPDPTPQPAQAPAALSAPTVRPTSPESAALRAYFTQVQAAQLTQGLLRRDGGGPDTPFTPAMLARNFEEIAFYNEYGGLAPGSSGLLRRWERPVRIGLEFGSSVPASQRIADTADVERYAARLKRVTGHAISVGGTPNFVVAVLSEDDREEALPAIAGRLGLNARDLARLAELPREIYCLVIAFPDQANPAEYASAIAIIRAENPDLLRLSCFHEEIAQGLGLANDSPTARPSIFNDDDEFALLTSHDEHLLAMLYDPRLKAGRRIEESGDLIRTLATERLDPEGAI